MDYFGKNMDFFAVPFVFFNNCIVSLHPNGGVMNR